MSCAFAPSCLGAKKSSPLPPPRVGRARAQLGGRPAASASRARGWRGASARCRSARKPPLARGARRARGFAGAAPPCVLPPPFPSACLHPRRPPSLFPLQTPAGRSGGTRAPRGSPRRSAARGRTSTATAASRRARCVPGAAACGVRRLRQRPRGCARPTGAALILARPPRPPAGCALLRGRGAAVGALRVRVLAVRARGGAYAARGRHPLSSLPLSRAHSLRAATRART